jgi:hypothetical protein
LLCIAVCWLTPRVMRWTLGPRSTSKARSMPLRARSIWFFPNGLFQHVPDGFCYAARAGVDEIILLGTTLGAQVSSYLLLPPAAAVTAISLFSLLALGSEYLLIVRPFGGGLTVAWRRILIVVMCVSLALLLFAVLTRNLSGVWSVLVLGLLIAAAVVANLLVTRRLLGVDSDLPRVLVMNPDRSQVAAIRRAFLLRGFTLLMVAVAVPTCGFLNLIYYENLRGYVGASLITASERIADQRSVLRKDIERRFIVDRTALQGLGIEGFDAKPPGWYLSDSQGIFSVSTPRANTLGKCAKADLITGFVERVTPHYASTNSEVRESSAQVEERCGDNGERWFDLAAPGDFVAPGARLDRNDSTLILRAGPSRGLSLHPRWESGAAVALGALLFGCLFYALLKRTATCLTGLYLTPVRPTEAVREMLNALIDADPAKAWAQVDTEAKQARLVALACGRTLNFADRAPIRALVEEGYLELTPYIRIANPRLGDFLRYDLPRSDRDRIMERAFHHRDHWDRMRLPVFVAIGAGCVLIAYTAPNAIELVMSAFLAVTALVPLARDPISRFIGTQPGG